MGGVRLTDRDIDLLGFAAEHRLILAAQAASRLGVTTRAVQARLRALETAGYVSRRHIFDRQPPAYQVRAAGLRAIASPLPVPRLDLRCYQHDVDLAWLWLAASRGAFGALQRIFSEREMRSQDGRGPAATHGVRLGGVGPGGRRRLHYPDLMLVTETGHRVAIELELSSKGRTRRERILAGYGADARVDAVVYLVKDQKVAGSIEASARRLGIADRVHVQRATTTQAPLGAPAGRTAGHSHSRAKETSR